MSDWNVLVPVEVLEGETIPESVVDLLGVLPVVVLGYHVVPEQTAPGQARLQFEEQAQKKLDDLADDFGDAGSSAETRLVFTHDEEQTLDRVAAETGCNAILIPNPAPDIDRLLVPLRGDVDVERVVGFVAALIDGRDIGVTLYHVGRDDDESAIGRELIDAAREGLGAQGVPETVIETEFVVSDTPIEAMTTAAVDHDAVVMGEREPSLQSFIFGEETEQVAERSLGPVVVVRRASADPDDPVDETGS
jgi:nucleotide-binding universal stress UspA family protein